MKHILTFETFNESLLKNITSSVFLLTSLLASPKLVAKGDENTKTICIGQKSKIELSFLDKSEYTQLVNDLDKRNYSIYGDKPQFDSHKFLSAFCISNKFENALNEALHQSEVEINRLELEGGYQNIYYIHDNNKWQVIVITELVSDEEEGREYDKTVGIVRGL